MSLILKLSKCRLCLKLGDFYSIFASDNTIQLAKMAMACSNIEVYEGDGLPDKICGECIEKLSSAYIFKQQCERSDAELRKNLLSNSGSTEISTYGRSNSDSGYSNRTDCSTSKKEPHQRLTRGRNNDSSPDKSGFASVTPLLCESYSVDVSDPLFYEGISSKQHSKALRSSDSRSNSPAINDFAKFICKHCNKTYSSARSLRIHTCKGKTNDGEDIKDDRDDTLSQNSITIVKMETIVKNDSSSNNMFKCEHCGKEFKFNIMLRRHHLVCDGTTSLNVSNQPVPVQSGGHKCPYCNRVFHKLVYLRKHHNRSGKCKKLKLQAENVKKSKTVKKNLEDATSALKVECCICKGRYVSHIMMFKHFQMCYKRRGSNATIMCKTCNTTFTKIQGLYKHIRRTHSNEKKSSARVLIPKTEPLSDDETHPASGKLKCRECDKTFTDQGELVMHLAAHMANISEPAKETLQKAKTSVLSNTESELECKECFKKFRYKASYRSHLRTAHDYSVEDLREMDRNVGLTSQCLYCERSFKTDMALKIHTNHKHSKPNVAVRENPVTLSECVMRCLLCNIVVEGSLEDKKQHNAMHAANKERQKNEYDCVICHQTFTSVKILKPHLSRHNKLLQSGGIMQVQDDDQSEDTSKVVDEDAENQEEGAADYEDDNDNEDINTMDFCESVIINIKQEKDEETSRNKTVNQSPSSSRHPTQQKTQNLVIALGGFTCVICNEILDTYEKLQEHMEQHQEGNQETVETSNMCAISNVCAVCDQEFQTESQMRRHMKEHIVAFEKDPSVLDCKECGRTNKNIRAFLAHHRWHKAVKELKCHICLKEFNRRSNLMHHFKMKHISKNEILDPMEDDELADGNVTPFQCYICKKYMLSAASLTCHVNWHSSRAARNLRRHQCNLCSFVSTNKRRLQLHTMKIHRNSPTPFQCKFCDLYFSNQMGLNLHLRAHKTGRNTFRKFQCPICDELFYNLLKMQRHLKRSHPESKMVKKKDPGAEDFPEIKYICKVCGKEFSSQEKLDIHGEKHTRKPTWFVCSLCGRRDISKKQHTLHIKGHMNQKFKDDPLKCEYCDKTFIKRQDHHMHLYEVHDVLKTYTFKTEDKKKLEDSLSKFQCNICYKTLAFEGSYLRHLDYHNSMRCNYCFKYFTNKTFLEAHMAYDCDRKKVLNSGDPFEKKLKCTDCYKAFSLTVKLRCHLWTQHKKELESKLVKKEEKATCDFCFSTFVSKEIMERHRMSHVRIVNYFGCKQCPKKFATVKIFHKHVKQTHRQRLYTDKPLQCDDCDSTFVTYTDYSVHLSDVHNKKVDWLVPPEKMVEGECPICHKVFERIHNHLNFHEKCRCKKCKEYFMADYLLESHVCPLESEDESPSSNKTNEKGTIRVAETSNYPLEPYAECNFCFKPYTLYYAKHAHERTHKTVLQFGCLYCDRTFTSIQSFKMHTMSHRFRHYKNNPLLCKHCGDKFVKYGQYIKHLREIHNDKESMILRPIYPLEECKICKKTFTNIHLHYRFHKQFQCESCHKYILSERLFKKHVCNEEDPNCTTISYDGDISELLEGKFDYAKLRHRPLDVIEETKKNKQSGVSIVNVNENSLSDMIDIRNTSLSSLSDSNQDAIVSIPDQVIFDKSFNSGSDFESANFKPLISSTVSLCANSENDDVDMIIIDEESPNPRCNLDTSIESSQEIQKIVDDLESSYPVTDTILIE